MLNVRSSLYQTQEEIDDEESESSLNASQQS
jgi:hypothetical protein